MIKTGLTSVAVLAFYLSFTNAQNGELAKSIERGKAVYVENCITCHMGNGEGLPPAFPPLARADYLIKTPVKALQAVKFGLQGKITVNGKVYDNAMPPSGLDNDEIADVMNYVMNSWSNSSKKMITPRMVEEVKK